jgi:Tfp pilus assembly protein PilF
MLFGVGWRDILGMIEKVFDMQSSITGIIPAVARHTARLSTRLIGLGLALLFMLTPPAAAQKRIALVIGNSAYKHAPRLDNPRNDAEGIAASLRRLKFEVLLGVDLTKTAMESLLQKFANKMDKAKVALVYYAGHGLQVGGRNYLIPVDGRLNKETDLLFQAVSLGLIQRLMEQGQRTNILILDACRDNPLGRNLARSMGTRSTAIGRGLGQTQAGVGTLIVYATQPGNVALDGKDKHSPFTKALLNHMETPGLEVRQTVIKATGGKQVPWDSSSLTGDFYLVAGSASNPTVKPKVKPKVNPKVLPADREVVFWQSIRNSKDAGDFQAYLERWPKGVFSRLARSRLRKLVAANAGTRDIASRKFTGAALATLHFSRAVSHHRQSHYKLAVADYSRALRLNPKLAVARYNRGVAHSRLKQYENAVADYKQAVRLDRRYVKAYNNLAWAYLKWGKAKQGVAWANLAIRSAPRDASNYDTRGRLFFALGWKTYAKRDFQTVLRLTKKAGLVAAAKAHLKRLAAPSPKKK